MFNQYLKSFIKKIKVTWLYDDILEFHQYFKFVGKILWIGFLILLISTLGYSIAHLIDFLHIEEFAKSIIGDVNARENYYYLLHVFMVFKWLNSIVAIAIFLFGMFLAIPMFLTIQLVLKTIYWIFKSDYALIKETNYLFKFYRRKLDKVFFRVFMVLLSCVLIYILFLSNYESGNLIMTIEIVYQMIIVGVIGLTTTEIVFRYYLRRRMNNHPGLLKWYDRNFYSAKSIRKTFFNFSVYFIWVIVLIRLYSPFVLNMIYDVSKRYEYVAVNEYHYEDRYNKLVEGLNIEQIDELKVHEIPLPPSKELSLYFIPFHSPSNTPFYKESAATIVEKFHIIALIAFLMTVIPQIVITYFINQNSRPILKKFIFSTVKSAIGLIAIQLLLTYFLESEISELLNLSFIYVILFAFFFNLEFSSSDDKDKF